MVITLCGNETPVQVAVELASTPAKALQDTTVSFPCSELRYSLTTVPTGIYCAEMTTETGMDVLTVKSGAR